MTEPYVGQIIQGGWNFAPRGYALCNGQILSIAQNTALFSLLGTTYGGNGQTTFALPNLQSRSMVGAGQGPGLSNYVLGQLAGQENVTLLATQMPTHNHPATFTSTADGSVNATTAKATASAPSAGALLGRAVDGAASPSAVPRIYAPSGTTPTVPLGGINVAGNVTTGANGSNLPMPNLAPYLGITHVIAMQGIYPSRN